MTSSTKYLHAADKEQNALNRDLKTDWNMDNMIKSALSVVDVNLFRKALSFTWLQWGRANEYGTGMLNKMINQQTNMAFMSALMVTMWTSMLTVGVEFVGEDDDLISNFLMASSCFGLALHLLCMFNSTLLLLAYNELSTDEEALEYSERIGILALSPLFQFLSGIGCGAIGISFFLMKFFSHFILIFTGCLACFLLPLYLGQFLYFIKELEFVVRPIPREFVVQAGKGATNREIISLSHSEIMTYWKIYVAHLKTIELVDPKEFKAYIKQEYHSLKSEYEKQQQQQQSQDKQLLTKSDSKASKYEEVSTQISGTKFIPPIFTPKITYVTERRIDHFVEQQVEQHLLPTSTDSDINTHIPDVPTTTTLDREEEEEDNDGSSVVDATASPVDVKLNLGKAVVLGSQPTHQT
jgi:hypothetical protein